MKVILSRKGFDSKTGGITSPIFEDGSMISFPIPSDCDRDKFDDLQHQNTSYAKILKDLNYSGESLCHVDPDLTLDRRKAKIENWCPIFGQDHAAAPYLLDSVKIKPGDLFLFFGNFHHVKKEDGKYKYVSKTNNFYMDKDLQVIWGYLQIGKIVTDPEEQKKYSWHPHSIVKRRNEACNVMFIASDRLSFAPNLPGAGTLPYALKRVLTAQDSNKATWIKNSVYDVDCVIGAHGKLGMRKNSSKIPNGIYYRGIWQELGLKESSKCDQWAESIIKD